MIYTDRPHSFEEIVSDMREQHRKAKRSLSERFPSLVPIFLAIRSLQRRWRDRNIQIARTHKTDLFAHVLSRHQSPLFRVSRDLGVDHSVYAGKVRNIKTALQSLNHLVIQSGETFSLLGVIGKTTSLRGYVPALQISRGRPIVGIGGGICQLGNLIYWSTLHTELSVTERYHHSVDVFPDSGRTIPFGTGATICYPTKDLRFVNTYDFPVQLEFGVTESQVWLKIRAPKKPEGNYHIRQEDHFFFSLGGLTYRTNRIYRDFSMQGDRAKSVFVYQNVFPVHYTVDPSMIKHAVA